MNIFITNATRENVVLIVIILLMLLLSACSSSEKSITADQAPVEYDLGYSMPKETISYDEKVRPGQESRCVVCHGCYDAPCQLKLSSPEGIHRGANKKKVYNGGRVTADEPTRLFIDAMTTEAWRQKGFDTVLNEGDSNPVKNLEDSVMYRMLRQKRLYPQARTGMLSDDFDIELDRKQSCPTLDEFDEYKSNHPRGGMPYAMPDLGKEEYTTLVHWLAQGAPMPEDKAPSNVAAEQIKQWEAFLNGDTNRTGNNKTRLVARYLYEHLFQAHLHFAGTDNREFYRLVRSTTAPGEPVVVIPTRRPYGDPASSVYYRLVRHQGSIVAKTHMVYQLSDKRMQRYRELFFDTIYEVDSLPSYEPTVASNPIKAFAAIPVKSRYKFLLDDARFFIEGFIKGPVCRGQIALNVIEDQFWVVFFDPEADIMALNDEFLNATADYLASPAELEDNYKVLSGKRHYRNLFQKYLQTRDVAAEADFVPVNIKQAMSYIWKGEGKNPNAALTIFRHLDSASVNYGFIGDYPESAWVIDYSVLERIHYLLVAGYDVYGNLGHQFNTRLYMDFLRTEGEDYFLAFLPADKRQAIRDTWYQGIRQSSRDDPGKISWLIKEIVSGYQTDNPQLELYQQMEQYLGSLAGDGDYINRCTTDKCAPKVSKNILRADKAMQRVAKMDGLIIEFLPDVAFVRVKMDAKPEQDLAYTMISNKAYKSVSSMFEGEKIGDRRDYQYDTQTVVRWLEGSYPDFFYVVELEDIERFVEAYNAIENRQQYEAFVARYGQRRTSEDFWLHADWFNQQYAREQPILSGIFDLNRYQNR